MNEELKTLVTNYKLGFISNIEFVCQYMDVLRRMGAERALSDKLNELVEPLAQHLLGILEGSNKTIEDFKSEEK